MRHRHRWALFAMSVVAAKIPEPELVLREQVATTAVVTLNRPEQRNSLSQAMLAAFGEILADIAGDRAVRAVVLAANGPAFCAGHDLKEITAHRVDADRGRGYTAALMESCSAVMLA